MKNPALLTADSTSNFFPVAISCPVSRITIPFLDIMCHSDLFLVFFMAESCPMLRPINCFWGLAKLVLLRPLRFFPEGF